MNRQAELESLVYRLARIDTSEASATDVLDTLMQFIEEAEQLAKTRPASKGAATGHAVIRVGCEVRVCTCHDDSAWQPGTYPHGCSQCGCHRA